MNSVYDKLTRLVRVKPRYNCVKCKDTGYILVKISPLDNKSINTLGKDTSISTKIPCDQCSSKNK